MSSKNRCTKLSLNNERKQQRALYSSGIRPIHYSLLCFSAVKITINLKDSISRMQRSKQMWFQNSEGRNYMLINFKEINTFFRKSTEYKTHLSGKLQEQISEVNQNTSQLDLLEVQFTLFHSYCIHIARSKAFENSKKNTFAVINLREQ